jgi:hypothetical protein
VVVYLFISLGIGGDKFYPTLSILSAALFGADYLEPVPNSAFRPRTGALRAPVPPQSPACLPAAAAAQGGPVGARRSRQAIALPGDHASHRLGGGRLHA